MIDVGTLLTAGGLVVTVVGGGGTIITKLIAREIAEEGRKRENSAKLIEKNQTDMKTDLRSVCDAHDKRIDRLEQKSVDFRSGDSIDAAISHAKNNVLTVVGGVKNDVSIMLHDSGILRDRVVRLETQHEQHASTLNEVKQTQKEMRQEINTALEVMTRTHSAQFDQLALSIRELRDMVFKPHL